MMADKRPDEVDDYRVASSKGNPLDSSTSQVALTDVELIDHIDYKLPLDASSSRSWSNRVSSVLLNLCCGYEKDVDDDEMNVKLELQKHNESRRRVENFYSLNQSKRDRTILNLNLIFILTISVCLYLFFSIPPELHVLRNVHEDSSRYFYTPRFNTISTPANQTIF
jgi:hypothetical protein